MNITAVVHVEYKSFKYFLFLLLQLVLLLYYYNFVGTSEEDKNMGKSSTETMPFLTNKFI